MSMPPLCRLLADALENVLDDSDTCPRATMGCGASIPKNNDIAPYMRKKVSGEPPLNSIKSSPSAAAGGVMGSATIKKELPKPLGKKTLSRSATLASRIETSEGAEAGAFSLVLSPSLSPRPHGNALGETS